WTNKFNTVTFTWYWDNIKSNLPQELQINTLNLIPVSGTSRKVLLLGTSRGVYLSLDEGYSWGTFNVNLPVQNVKDIQYAPQTKVLIAGIFGRGVFKTSLDKLVTPSTAPSVEVILPKDPNCDLLLPTEGGTATLSYKVNNQLDNSGIKKVSWSVEGASPSPGETSDKNKFTVSIPNPADEVTVFVEIEFNNGIKISGLKKFNTITQEDARLRGIVCELKKERLKPKPWWEWDPAKWRWDPKRNMVIRIPYTRAELIQIEKQSQLFLQQLREQIKGFR
ncbi:MAG TPA: hypothetical protein VGD17_16400, partial [Chitinophagaceae bacterium]